MRKSAVSVRSGAGMPAHMAEDRSAEGGEEMQGKERKGQCDPPHMLLGYIWEDMQQMSL